MVSITQESSPADRGYLDAADGVNEPDMTQAVSAFCCPPEVPSWPQVTDLFPDKCQSAWWTMLPCVVAFPG